MHVSETRSESELFLDTRRHIEGVSGMKADCVVVAGCKKA